MAFTHGFEPATNKDGQSLGIFQGYELLEGLTPLLDRKTKEPVMGDNNEPVMRKWEIVALLFDVKGRVAGNIRTLKLTTNGQFGSSGELETALKSMGWVNELVSVEIDEDGLEVERTGDVEIDEDGLEVVTADIDALTFESFKDFVDRVKGSKFWLKIGRDAKGYLKIEPGSVTPKV